MSHLHDMPAHATIGLRRYHRGIDYRPMTDSSLTWHRRDFPTLTSRLHADGYLLIRQVIPCSTARHARRMILEHIALQDAIVGPIMDAGIAVDAEGRCVQGWTVDAESGGVIGDRDDDSEPWATIGNSRALQDVYNGPALHQLYQGLFGDSFATQPGSTWMRVRGHGDITVEHADYYYFKAETDLFHKQYRHMTSYSTQCCSLCDRPYDGSAPQVNKGEWHCASCADGPLDVYTCWVALGNISFANGTLWIRPGTHKLTGFAHQTADQPDVPSPNPPSIWESTEFQPGDIVLFHIKTIHAASKNTTKTFRLSLDTRVIARPWRHPSTAISMEDRCFYLCLATLPQLSAEEQVSVIFLLGALLAHETCPLWWKHQFERAVGTTPPLHNRGIWRQGLQWAHVPLPALFSAPTPETWSWNPRHSWYRAIADMLSAAYSSVDDRQRQDIIHHTWERLYVERDRISAPLRGNRRKHQLSSRDTNRIYFLTHVILLDTSWGIHAPAPMDKQQRYYWFDLLWKWFHIVGALDSPEGYIREVWLEIAICLLLLYHEPGVTEHRQHTDVLHHCTMLDQRLQQCNASPITLRRRQGIYHTHVESGRDPWIVHYHLPYLVLLFHTLYQRVVT